MKYKKFIYFFLFNVERDWGIKNNFFFNYKIIYFI